MCPSMWSSHYHKYQTFFFMDESLLSHFHLLVCCPIHVSTEGETVVSSSDLSRLLVGSLHEQDGWREEETWPASTQDQLCPQYMLILLFSPPGLLGRASISIGAQADAATGLTTGTPDQAPLGEGLMPLLELTPLPEERGSW